MSEEKFVDSCKGCVFAQRSPFESSSYSQLGCEMGRVQKYVNLGMAFLNSASEPTYELKKKCNYKLLDIDSSTPPTFSGMADKVRSSKRVKAAAIILVNKRHGMLSYIDLDAILAKVTAWRVGVNGEKYPLYDEVFLVNNRSDCPPAELQQHLEKAANLTGHPNCQLVHMMQAETEFVALDEAVSRIRSSHFYTVITANESGVYGHNAVDTLPQSLNYLINEEIKPFVGIAPKDVGSLNGLTIHTMTHRRDKVGGNMAMVFENEDHSSEVVHLISDKLQRLSEAWELPGLVEEFSVLGG